MAQINTILFQVERLGGAWAGILIPAVVFTISFVLTWMLYKHFSKKT